jgi:hypothetical protein
VKILKNKSFEVETVIPETKEEDDKIKKIIHEVKNEKFDYTEWEKVTPKQK